MGQQRADDFQLSERGGEVQRSIPLEVRGVGVRAVVEKDRDGGVVAVAGAGVEGGEAGFIAEG